MNEQRKDPVGQDPKRRETARCASTADTIPSGLAVVMLTGSEDAFGESFQDQFGKGYYADIFLTRLLASDILGQKPLV